LRELNKERGVKDHGQSDDMKSFAARVIVEDWFSLSHDVPGAEKLSDKEIEVFAGRVRAVMDKASTYLEAGEPGDVTFPVLVKFSRNS